MKPKLTKRQGQVLGFIIDYQREHGSSPSQREIAAFFGFRSITAVADHLKALRRKGYLEGGAHRARSLRVMGSPSTLYPVSRSKVVDIPILGAIPAGFADQREEAEVEG
ncbi:MAG: LexA family protein, partial [Limisphaerales bacterium]